MGAVLALQKWFSMDGRWFSGALNDDWRSITVWAAACFVATFSVSSLLDAYQNKARLFVPQTYEVLLPAATVQNKPARDEISTQVVGEFDQDLKLKFFENGQLVLTGRLNSGSAAVFLTELSAYTGKVSVVTLNSPGGLPEEAIKIGKIIRENGWNTAVLSGNVCVSSCPILLASGVRRIVQENATIGVHQLYSASDAEVSKHDVLSKAQSLTADISRYLRAMGLDERLWLHALDTTPNNFYYFTNEQLRAYRLVTES